MTRRRGQIARSAGAALPIWIAGLTFVVLVVGPFLVPIPPLEGTVDPKRLGDADSEWVTVGGVDVHFKRRGRGAPTVLMLHGFGASLFSWREAFDRLSDEALLVAYDRPGFGLTERPRSWLGESPYGPGRQVELAFGVLDEVAAIAAPVVLVGHSAGAAVAMELALDAPDRFSHLVLVAPAVVGAGGPPQWMKSVLSLPQIDRFGPLMTRDIAQSGLRTLERAWHDPTRLTADVIEGYRRPLAALDWDLGLWELAKASRPRALESRFDALTQPVLVVTGDDDRVVPTAATRALADRLPNASLLVIERCGHVPHEECPEAFVDGLLDFLDANP